MYGIAALAVSCIPYALSYCILYGFQRECFCAFQGNLQRNFAYCIMAFTLPASSTTQRCGRVAARAIVPTLGAQLPCHCHTMPPSSCCYFAPLPLLFFMQNSTTIIAHPSPIGIRSPALPRSLSLSCCLGLIKANFVAAVAASCNNNNNNKCSLFESN